MSNTRVAETVWPWRQAGENVSKTSPPSPRGRAVIEAMVMSAVALTLRWHFDREWAPYIVGALASFVLLSGLFAPALYHRFHRGLLWLGKMTGLGMTWLLLVPFFYICFPIGRVLFALKGRDPLTRKFESRQPSYWIKRPPAFPPERYRHQYWVLPSRHGANHHP